MAELQHHERRARFEDAANVREPGLQILEVADAERNHRPIETIVVERQIGGIRLNQLNAISEALLLQFLAAVAEHPFRDVRAVADIEGWSENTEARSIADRFLEHARVFHFANGGDDVLYLASADCMKRNLSRRIEVAFLIYDEVLREEIKHILDLLWADDAKARILDADQSNAYHRSGKPTGVRAQFDTYRWLAEWVKVFVE